MTQYRRYQQALIVLIALVSTCRTAVIQRICIIGGGTAGLGLAASLKQMTGTQVKDVTVFEARKDFLQSQLGGGVQLSGGAAILEKINCLPALQNTAQPLRKIVSRNNQGQKLLEVDISAGVRALAKEQLCADGGAGEPMIYAVMREKLLSILFDATKSTRTSSTTSNSGNSGSSGNSGNSIISNKRSDTTSPSVTVKAGKRLSSIVEDSSTGQLSVLFEDGSTTAGFDLVVAADGIASKAREFTGYGAQLLIPNPLDSGRTEGGSYTGIRIAYCVTPPENDRSSGSSGSSGRSSGSSSGSSSSNSGSSKGIRSSGKGGKESAAVKQLRCGVRDTFHQWFGDSAYVLAGSYGGSYGTQHMLAVVYTATSDSTYGENPNWTETAEIKARIQTIIGGENPNGTETAEIKDRIQTIIGGENPNGTATAEIKARIQTIIGKAGLGENEELTAVLEAASQSGGRFFDLGVRDSSVPLKKWSSDSGGVLLMGDSAHAMSPFLGQGANQAIQDGYCLATLIRDANIRSSNSNNNSNGNGLVTARKSVAREFERRRKPPTAALAAKSNILGRIETLGSPIGVFAKNSFFAVTGAVGVAKREFINGAIPRV